ncbi:MAG: SGNH family hydrolase [Pseudomonadota bacterium]
MRRLFAVCLALVFFLTGTPAPRDTVVATLLPGVETANAQKERRRSLLGILFGRKKVKKKAVKTRQRATKRRTTRRKRTVKRKTRTRRAATRRTARSKAKKAAPAAAAVAKADDAKKVLVIGDFYAGGLADALQEAYAALPDIKVLDHANGLSGFVRQDVVNWPEKLKELVAAEKPDHIVAMLGSNDRQLLREGGKKLKKRTPEWDTAYKARVQELGEVLKASRIKYTWMGLPPVRFKNMSRDFLVFNSIYAEAAKSPNGRFVDVWDGFADADGNYSRSGPDVNGQIVLLRPKDGINLTKAGKRRLAFYIQNDLQKQLTDSTSLINPNFVFDFTDNVPRQATYDPAKTGTTVVIRLNDPKVDGAETLAGEKIETGKGTADAFRVPVSVRPSRPIRKEGRVDDFSWPPQPGSTGTQPAQTASRSTNVQSLGN